MAGYSVAGKVALVTGAARGIGFETARLLHERGASVVVVDLDQGEADDAARQIGERALAIGADVTDTAAMQAAVDAAVERFGGLDICVANAGLAPEPSTFRTADLDAFERVLEVDLQGVVRTVHPALPQVAARGGQVVVVASVYAFLNGVLATPYAMAKAGVEQFGRALRVELRPHGASASVAYFGFIDTRMVQETFAHPIAQRWEEAFPAVLLKRLPPAAAGRATVDGIEHRRPRIILPRRWRVYSVLRGLVNPLLDARMERDRRIQGVVRDGDAERADSLGQPAS